MDSWTLQGDSYSFLRSAPRTFSLCHRDGTPNHVEIFDIINVPSQRSAISETTCLCDIFGDDCESSSLSSSPAAVALVPTQRKVDSTAAASPLVDELNDSSGSYHTAQGSSEGEEGSEDSGERVYSPALQNESSEKKQLEDKALSSEHSQVCEESILNLTRKSKSPELQLSSISPSLQVFNCGERTPSPGHSSPNTLSPEGRLSSLSSSSAEKRLSSSSPHPKQAHSESEPSITPSFTDRQSSPSNPSLTPSPSFPQYLLEPTACHLDPNGSPIPEITRFSENFTDSDCESRAILSSPLPSPSGLEIRSHLGGTAVSPELRNISPFSDPQVSSPFSELRGRVSLPDLFSRGSTPDIKDSFHSPELISDPSSSGRDTASPSERQDIRSSGEPHSTVSTPCPRYTPPSPVISVATSPELVGSTVSPDSRNTGASPVLLSAASPANTGTRSPSPDPSAKTRNTLTFSDIRTQVSSPVVSYSLSPSPGIRDTSSPLEHRYTSPSPEIRIIASSPEVSRKEQPSEVETSSVSPFLEPLVGSASPRSFTSSPHITGISYSVVQPEDRDSPPFPELSHLSSPEPVRTPMSSEASRDSVNSSAAESTGTPQELPPISGFVSSEEALLPQTPSPQPNHLIPSPEPRYQTLSSDEYQSPSPLCRSRDPSPVVPFPEQSVQHSPVILPTEYKPLYTQPGHSGRNTPVVEADSFSVGIIETQSPTHLTEDRESPTFDWREKEAAAEVKSNSLVVAAHSPISVSSEKSADSSLIQQTKEIGVTPKEVYLQDKSRVLSFTEEKQDLHPPFHQEENTYTTSPSEIKSASSNLTAPKDRSPNISPVHRALSNQTLQTQRSLQSLPTSYSLTPACSNFSPATTCAPVNLRRQRLTGVRSENADRFAEDMSHHANRRQTPSPPLTRFTPVHIIAPQKPYRQWQNRSRSPSQVLASSSSGNLKKATTNRESPNDDPFDNNSQPHWVRRGRQSELEREMPLEQERDVGMERRREREMDREREREERAPERREGRQRVTSYRGEQVELSFSARNRKGPVSCGAAPTSREPRQGLPTANSYSESSLATRQLQQQQSLLRLASQQDSRGGGASRRPQPPVPQNKRSTPGRVAANRPCQSSGSSMGSELDEADNEVKWFTDLAFRSLSSPEVDYLDMYNSSHRSSTNISQPSTQESPAGVNATWPAYADFRGSAPKLDHDELPFQQPYAYYSDRLDPSRRSELGSFECIDVAVEREDYRKARKGVPKRQIQLKRKNNGEGKQGESSENSSPGLPVMVESPPKESHPRGTFLRQHSTPAAMQECFPSERSPEPNKQKERQSKLQKSASMDETCSKTKLASCLIKSVLSKKMQSVDRQPDEQAGEEAIPPIESAAAPLKASPKPDSRSQSSGLQSDYNPSSEDPFVRGEPGPKDELKPSKSHVIRSSNRPSSTSSCRSVTFSQTDSEEADSQSRSTTSLRSEIKSELKVPSDSKLSRPGLEDGKAHLMEESDPANTPSPSARRASGPQAGVTNRSQECENTEDHKRLLQGEPGAYTSKTQEITLKAVEKKKASLNVCLTPESESKPGFLSPDVSVREKQEKPEVDAEEKTEEERENSRVKAPIHKVRDVRRLVKNTYNLSFKAASAAMPSNENEERMKHVNEENRDEPTARDERDVMQEIRGEGGKEEELWVERKEEQKEEAKDSEMLNLPSPAKSKENSPSGPQPMQIEYKAVCWKDDKNKMTSNKRDEHEKAQAFSKSVMEGNRESRSMYSNIIDHTTGDSTIQRLCEHDVNITAETQKTTTESHKVSESEDKHVVTRADRKPPMLGSLPKMPSKEREVSTAVVLIRERPNKTNISASPAQEESPAPVQAPDPVSLSPGPTTPGSGGHSVSMLLKEKGYQADIGAVVGENQNTAGGKGVARKHVNSLEIPLQTTPSSNALTESHRERTFSSSSATSGPSAAADNADAPTKSREEEGISTKPPRKETAKQRSNAQEQTPSLTKQKDMGDFEAVKRLDPTFPPRSPAIRRFKPQPIEVKSLSKEPQKQEMTTNSAGNHRPQTIEVKSIAKNSQKPAVPPKPSCKFKPADLGAAPNEAQRTSSVSSNGKPQGEERPQTIVVSSPTIYRKISNESASASNYSRKLAVSTVSSLKPPPHKTTTTTIPSLSNHPTSLSSEAEAAADRGQQQQPAASPQSSRHAQKPGSLATSVPGLGITSAPGPGSDPKPNQIPGPSEASQPVLMDSDSQLQHPRVTYPHEQAMPITSNNAKQPTAVSTTQVPRYTIQRGHRSLSSDHAQRTDELHFYASDDPPSYDERESFSPLLLPDLNPMRQNRYQPSCRHPPCSCTTGCLSHPVPAPPHHHRSPHNLTPPAPPHSPGQAIPYPVTQPPLRPHQCRPEPQPMSYQPGSPKLSPLGPNQPSSMYQPLHQSAPCPPHPSLMQACSADRPLPPNQHIDPRRPPVHRSPHQQPPSISGAPYIDPGHSHSPGLPSMDPQYLCGPQNMGPSYGSEYGGDSSSLYSESSYGQTPRRVLLDPETGKYFYIEVPVQPLRKMLFDPETGQYVEVLIPQQAMSHSGLYPPSAAPFPPLHSPNMYAPAPQYMPCAAPPPLAHPQAQPQPPRYPEASAAAAMHPSGPGVSYRNVSGPGSKPEPQNHPSLDHSYLESMYYVPTGMNASPNPTPPDYYHKHPPNLPPAGGKRS